MILVADVHGAAEALRRVAALGDTLVVLGDLINFIDYRDNRGIVSEVSGLEFVDEMVRRRTEGDFVGAGRLWREHAEGREEELAERYAALVDAEYRAVCAALRGTTSYVIYGNADRPGVLRRHLPREARFVDAEVVEIDGRRVGFAAGGLASLGTPGEVTEAELATKLASLGPVDVLCTHVPPDVPALAQDVIGGRTKGSRAVLDYLRNHQPPWHYFGDIHQPQATQWRIGATRCRNVGYFRATGRPVRHRP